MWENPPSDTAPDMRVCRSNRRAAVRNRATCNQRAIVFSLALDRDDLRDGFGNRRLSRSHKHVEPLRDRTVALGRSVLVAQRDIRRRVAESPHGLSHRGTAHRGPRCPAAAQVVEVQSAHVDAGARLRSAESTTPPRRRYVREGSLFRENAASALGCRGRRSHARQCPKASQQHGCRRIHDDVASRPSGRQCHLSAR